MEERCGASDTRKLHTSSGSPAFGLLLVTKLWMSFSFTPLFLHIFHRHSTQCDPVYIITDLKIVCKPLTLQRKVIKQKVFPTDTKYMFHSIWLWWTVQFVLVAGKFLRHHTELLGQISLYILCAPTEEDSPWSSRAWILCHLTHLIGAMLLY